MPRIVLDSDTFDTAISSSWANGDGDWTTLSWAAGGFVQPTAAAVDAAMRWNAREYPRAQWSQIVVNTHSDTESQLGTTILGHSGIDESLYVGFIGATGPVVPKYEIFSVDSVFAFVTLGSSGTAPASWTAGDTATLETDGDGNLRLYTSESGGADALRLTVFDATITFGNPGIEMFTSSNVALQRVTSWSAGYFDPIIYPPVMRVPVSMLDSEDDGRWSELKIKEWF